jgi:hypothetical protein
LPALKAARLSERHQDPFNKEANRRRHRGTLSRLQPRERPAKLLLQHEHRVDRLLPPAGRVEDVDQRQRRRMLAVDGLVRIQPPRLYVQPDAGGQPIVATATHGPPSRAPTSSIWVSGSIMGGSSTMPIGSSVENRHASLVAR